METSFLSESQKSFVKKVESFHDDMQSKIELIKDLSEQLREAIDEFNSSAFDAFDISSLNNSYS